MTVLDALLASARARAAAIGALDEVAMHAPRPSFAGALRGRARLSVIAEYKRASPSAGELAPERPLEAQLHRYRDAGAAAVSVLTEPTRFGGAAGDLRRAARSCDLPLLRKDFLVDPRQVEESAALGAAAVLLIVRCLAPRQLRDLAEAARALGLDVLVECHDAAELERALDLPQAVVGINNRDLDRLDVDRARARALLPRVPAGRVAVAESGYASPGDCAVLRGAADAVLVGSALMRAPDPAALLRGMRGAAASPPPSPPRPSPPRLPRVKVCGVTRPEDADRAAALGAAFVGCVLAPDSPRRATRAQVRAVRDAVAGRAEVVLVFRDAPAGEVLAAVEDAGVRRVQMHGAPPATLRRLAAAGITLHRVHAVPAGATRLPPLQPAPTPEAPAVLDVGRGGSGRRFDWSLLGDAAPEAVFVAGGITPDHLPALLARRPWGVDASSGLESAPGRKDPDLLRRFFRALRDHAPAQT